MKVIKVNFDKVIGIIKPMHGVGQPPIRWNKFHMFDYLQDALVPYSRLHDVGGAFGGNLYVDIPNLFRDFDADPNDPAAYDFVFTDRLITALVERGIEPFFRLGVTIENYAAIKPYRIFPPKDYHKWARICEGVIRHYTEGWADGFCYKINYWEIWNEPDNYEEIEENQTWRGTKEEFYEFYEVASKYLKGKFPHLKIGGYASCGFGAISAKEAVKEANSSPRFEYFIQFFDGFLEYLQEHSCPLDFFSWHSYGKIEENVVAAAYVRKRLDDAGFKHTEHTLNEWNCRPRLLGTMEHAALTCGMLLALQDTSLDSAMFYDARCGIGNYSGMFHGLTEEPYPAYYAFLAFAELYRRKNQVDLQMDIPGVYACAAKNENVFFAKEETGCIVLANTNAEDVEAAIEVLTGSDSECTKKLCGTCRISRCVKVEGTAIWKDSEWNGVLPGHSIVCLIYQG